MTPDEVADAVGRLMSKYAPSNVFAKEDNQG